MDKYNLSLPAETIDSLLLWLDDKQDVIIKQTDLLSGTGQSTTATMTQKAITDALGTKADASSVYTKTQTDTLLALKADKSTTYTKTETDNLLNSKQDTLTFDDTPTEDSPNPVTSGGIFDAIESAVDGLANIIGTKQPKDTDAVAGNVAVMDAGGSSVDGGVALTDLATKAEVEAVEQEVAQVAGEAGLAEAVIDTDGAGTEQEFTFRKSGGDGGAYYRKIKGKTIVVDDQLASNDAEAVETTGVNQWDEEWRNDGYYGENGIWTYNPERYISSKNIIPIFGGTAYYFKFTRYGYLYFYDAAGNFISRFSTSAYTFAYTTPANAAYMHFSLYYGSGVTYDHDICINLSNPAINGQYFPYWKRTLRLGITTRKDTDGNVPFADGMKGAGTASDWADKVGGEKIMGRVDLGSLNWNYEATGLTYPRFNAIVPQMTTTNYVTNLISPDYSPNTSPIAQTGQDKTMCGYSGRIYIYNFAYTSAADFKAAMNGVMLDYPLATPVPFTWAEPLNLGVKVDENGTERAVAPEGATTPSAPFVADTTYTMSVARMVEILKNL